MTTSKAEEEVEWFSAAVLNVLKSGDYVKK